MTGLEIMLLIAAGRAAQALFKRSQTATSTSSTPSTPPAGKTLTLVGRASSGKSSLGNALIGRPVFAVGVEHGTTTETARADHVHGYVVQDTPGLLDDTDHSPAVWTRLPESGVVVYVSPGQLFRHELEAVARIHRDQQAWDAANGTPGRRKLVVFVSFADIKRETMPSMTRAAEATAIKAQVSEWIPADRVFFGAAGGTPSQTDIDPLEAFVKSEFHNW